MYSLKNISGLEEMVELYRRSMNANLPIETVHEIEIHKTMTTKNDILVALAEGKAEGRE